MQSHGQMLRGFPAIFSSSALSHPEGPSLLVLLQFCESLALDAGAMKQRALRLAGTALAAWWDAVTGLQADVGDVDLFR